jgi:hypothetical protein
VGETRGGPLQWRRSHHSGSTGGQCVEVAAVGDGLVRIRDSKDPDGPQIVVSVSCWRRSLPRLAASAGVTDVAGVAGAVDCLVAARDRGWVLLRHARRSASLVLRFTPGEWEVFLRGARDGDFDLTADGRLRPVAPPARHLRELAAAWA